MVTRACIRFSICWIRCSSSVSLAAKLNLSEADATSTLDNGQQTTGSYFDVG